MLMRLAIALCVLAAVIAGVPAMQQLIGPASPTAPSKPTSKTVTTVAQAASRAQAAGPVRVELSEQEVNRILASGLRQHGYQVDDLVVRLEEGRFVATTSQQVAFFRVPVTIVGSAEVVGGELAVNLSSVTAGGANVPQDVVDQVVANFRTQLAADVDALAVRPASVELKPGRLVVQGTPK